MKRLPFKPEHVESVKNGTKRFTSRWGAIPRDLGDNRYKVGDLCAATTSMEINGRFRPAFLVPASLAFCHVRIVGVVHKKWPDFTEDDAAKCGVTRDWYLRHSPPPIPDLHWITTYEFEVEAIA